MMIKIPRRLLCVKFCISLLASWGLVSSLTPITHDTSNKHSRRALSMADSSEAAEATQVGPIPPEIPPMSKRLFLVRHGEVINPGGDRAVYYGAMDVSLSPLGKEEAAAAARYLSQFDLEHVFASPLSRAIFGAEEVRKMQVFGDDITLTINDGFKELDRGAWCGKTIDEIGKEAMAKFDACDESVTPEGGESFPFLKTRVLRAQHQALEKLSPGRAAALVSHLQVTRSMLSEAQGIPISEIAKLKVGTASVTCIDYDTVTSTKTVHFESFKPDVGLSASKDATN